MQARVYNFNQFNQNIMLCWYLLRYLAVARREPEGLKEIAANRTRIFIFSDPASSDTDEEM